ncbi:MAG: hypothetical protein JRI91_01655 [Deltaproteobacteria bacterium]|nr:hypothetical protein [Deltaproteobacteria bacterium]
MAANKKATPDFFGEDPFDPVTAAIGTDKKKAAEGPDKRNWLKKKKAGFYLSVDLLDRFNRKFHELKLEGVLIDNKSSLIEAALSFALDDIDRGDTGEVLKKLKKNSN